MKNNLRASIVIAAVLIMGGCATTNTIYYWGDYSDSAYQYKKEPTLETLGELKESLLDIIENANNKNKKIPPGIYAELAKIELEANNLDAAKQLLLKEKMLFPESTTMVEALVKMINDKESENA